MPSPASRAAIDPNFKGSLLAVSNVDFKTPVAVAADPTTGALAVDVTVDATNVTVTGNVAAGATDSGNPVKVGGVYNSTLPTLTTGQRGDLQLDAKSIAMMNMAYKLDATNDAIAAWAFDGSGNALTSNSTTFTSKKALDGNLLGTLGTAFTTAGKVDVKGADGDVFIRQTTASNLNTTAQITDGTNTANILNPGSSPAGQNAQLIAPARYETSFSISSNTASSAIDVSNFAWISVQITGQGASARVNFQGSNDNSNWIPVILNNEQNTTGNLSASSTINNNIIYQGPTSYRYFRVNITGLVSGTSTGTIELFTSAKTSSLVTITSNTATGSAVPVTAYYQGFRNNSGNLQGADVMAQTSVTNDASHQAAQLTAGAFQEVTFTTTSAQAVASTEVSNYKWVSVHITSQGGSSTVAFQGSNDNSNWVNQALIGTTNTANAPVGTTTATGIFFGPLSFRYFRLNVTGIVSGTTAGVIELYTSPNTMHTMGSSAAQNGTWTVGSNSATGSAVPANAFMVGISDGTNLQALKTASNIGDNNGLGASPAIANYTYNGSNWDRQRSNLDNITAVASAAYTSTQTQADQTNFNHRGIIVTVDITVNAGGSGSITPEIDYKDPVSGKYLPLLTTAALTSVATTQYTVYPGITASANVSASMVLPRTWRVKVTANNANSVTYSVGCALIL